MNWEKFKVGTLFKQTLHSLELGKSINFHSFKVRNHLSFPFHSVEIAKILSHTKFREREFLTFPLWKLPKFTHTKIYLVSCKITYLVVSLVKMLLSLSQKRVRVDFRNFQTVLHPANFPYCTSFFLSFSDTTTGKLIFWVGCKGFSVKPRCIYFF